MNILVTGAKGQLGEALKKAVPNTINNYIFTDIEDLDITCKKDLDDIFKKHNIDLVVNCAAYTNVDKAEEEPHLAEQLNGEAVGDIGEIAANHNAFVIHISTDYVFGGNNDNTPISEEAQVNPLGVYGKTKLRGEEKLKSSGARHLIIRTSWLYSETGKNFVKTMIELTGTKPQLKVVFDQCGTPTYAGDLAEAIVDIIENKKYKGKEGIYHFSNEGVCSWYDFSKKISELAGHNCNIQPCHSDEFPSKVKRPAYSVLDKTKFKKTFEREIPYWTDSLIKCMQNINKEVPHS